MTPGPEFRLESPTAGDVVTTHDPADCEECFQATVTARMVAASLGGAARSARGDHVAEWRPHGHPAGAPA